jgi:hypothetical protein
LCTQYLKLLKLSIKDKQSQCAPSQDSANQSAAIYERGRVTDNATSDCRKHLTACSQKSLKARIKMLAEKPVFNMEVAQKMLTFQIRFLIVKYYLPQKNM